MLVPRDVLIACKLNRVCILGKQSLQRFTALTLDVPQCKIGIDVEDREGKSVNNMIVDLHTQQDLQSVGEVLPCD